MFPDGNWIVWAGGALDQHCMANPREVLVYRRPGLHGTLGLRVEVEESGWLFVVRLRRDPEEFYLAGTCEAFASPKKEPDLVVPLRGHLNEPADPWRGGLILGSVRWTHPVHGERNWLGKFDKADVIHRPLD